MDDHSAANDPRDLVLVHVRACVRAPAHPPFDRIGFAGVVEAAGRRVTAFGPGVAVYGVGEGAFAGYLCAPQHEIALMPSSLGFAAAAVVPVAGLTALQALRDRARLQPSERLLVTGGGGAATHLAVQLGVHRGAHVAVAFSQAAGNPARRAEIARLDSTSASKYDVVVHFGVGSGRDTHVRLLAPGGRLVLVHEAAIVRSGADLTALAALIDAGVLTAPSSAPPGCT